MVEAIGVSKSLKAIEDTDMIIYLIDITRGVEAKDIELLDKIRSLGKPYIIGLNKIDISREKLDSIKEELKAYMESDEE